MNIGGACAGRSDVRSAITLLVGHVHLPGVLSMIRKGAQTSGASAMPQLKQRIIRDSWRGVRPSITVFIIYTRFKERLDNENRAPNNRMPAVSPQVDTEIERSERMPGMSVH